MKPILFNTEMVKAILEGRKTVTRRVIKPSKGIDDVFGNMNKCKQPYQVGDILYVRETWGFDIHNWLYKADFSDEDLIKLKRLLIWHPSIHMPKKAARIFLKVTDVRVERLQDIFDDSPGPNNQIVREGFLFGCDFIAGWENTIKKTDRNSYGWDANPWVWVIEFEKIER